MSSPPRVEPPPGSTAALRNANQQRVWDLLRRSGAPLGGEGVLDDTFTQAELARMTGLAPATVSSIVRELSAAGLVDAEAGRGRRGSSVRIAKEAGIVAGVDFGHSHVAVAVGDLTGRVLAERRIELADHTDHGEALDLARDLLTGLRAGRGDVRHVGLGVPAPVTDDVAWPPAIFPGWEGIDAPAVAQARFGAPVHIENDANLGALAEHRRGVARGHDSSIFVKISSGVGAGIIIDNALFRGARGAAGEIGHLTFDDQGPLCRCGGRGCLEAYASTHSVLDMVTGQLPGADIDQVVAAAMDGNVSAQRTLEEAGLRLGWGLASVVNLLNPEIVVVGGDMARAGELLLQSARTGLRRHALDSVALTPVVASELGERASLVGAVLLAAERTELLLD